MKLVSLRLAHLGVWHEAALEFPTPVTLVFGENATGKTTLARAIEVLLTGEIHAFRGHRLSAKALLSAATGGVSGDLIVGDRKVTIRRSLGAELVTEVNGHPTSKAVADFFSPPGMRNPDGAWRVACNVSRCLDIEDADLKAFLMDLVEPSLPPEALAALVPAAERMGIPVPKTLADMATAFDAAYALRRTTKAALASKRVIPAPPTPRQPVEAITRKLAALRSEEAELLKGEGAAQERHEQAQKRLGAARLTLERARIEATEAGPLADADTRLSEAREALSRAQKDRAAFQEAGQARAELQTRLNRLRSWQSSLKGLGAACVISSDIACPLPGSKREEHQASWAKAVEVIEQQLAAVPEHPLPDLSKMEQRVKTTAAAVEEIRRLNAAVEMAATDLTQAEAAVTAEPTSGGSLATLRERISKGERALETARDTNRAWDDHEASMMARSEGERAVADLEALCAGFGPKGVGERLLTERLGEVEGRVNAVLTALHAPSVTFRATPWAILFAGRHPVLLSASERFRAGLALQLAVAGLTGARWLLVDGLDILDGARRADFLALAGRAVLDGTVEQIIATSTLVNRAAVTSAVWPAWVSTRILDPQGTSTPPPTARP